MLDYACCTLSYCTLSYWTLYYSILFYSILFYPSASPSLLHPVSPPQTSLGPHPPKLKPFLKLKGFSLGGWPPIPSLLTRAQNAGPPRYWPGLWGRVKAFPFPSTTCPFSEYRTIFSEQHLCLQIAPLYFCFPLCLSNICSPLISAFPFHIPFAH